VKVIVGGNTFIDCGALVAFRGAPVIRVEINPLRIILDPPPGLPAVVLKHNMTDRSDAIFSVENSASVPSLQAIAMATLIDADTVNLALDLRPIGMNIVADLRGLHIGSNLFVGNVIERAVVGINLG
jgi:hypothetical protein